MATEIERKFLVSEGFRDEAHKSTYIKQGYLSSVPERAVRVRIKDDKGFITIKGASSECGQERYEWEREIPLSEAEELMLLCEKGIIEKRRHVIDYRGKVFEVDEFFGDNSGLILCEVELAKRNENVELPEWIIKEVTGDNRYYNVYLTKFPYTGW
ncbi:MAG: CYTH domain-containing protein [Bacteroidales bacterium]|jgi:adenylate cyclase|nr:CYTH domain-containing protein [Bacteroidales bacterium]